MQQVTLKNVILQVVDDIVQAEGIKVDEGLHKDLVTIMKNKPDENATE